MYKIQDYKEKIIKCLKDLERHATLSNSAGKFDLNKDAEEFYRGLLNLFYGWHLKAMNDNKDPNYEGIDLGCKESKVAVQVTSERDSEKVHHSIKGFRNKGLTSGYEELYVLMFRGKSEFPRADFHKTVDGSFVFDKSKHIIDHNDLCSKLKDAEFEYIENIYNYLDSTVGLSYVGLDESLDDLDIISKIFEYIKSNKPSTATPVDRVLLESSIDLLPKIEINFPLDQRDTVKRLMTKVWDKKQVVQMFISHQVQEDEISVNELIFDIQDRFCSLKGSTSPEVTISNIAVIKDLAKSYLPEKWLNHIHYVANAEALVFYFFEFCYIGEKKLVKQGSQVSLF